MAQVGPLTQPMAGWLEQPQLIESKAVVQNGRRINEFGMNFVLTRVKPEDGKEKK